MEKFLKKKNKLSPREKEVLLYTARGLSNNQIAEILYVSNHTVNAHLDKIYEKLEVHNKMQAVITACKYEIINIYEI